MYMQGNKRTLHPLKRSTTSTSSFKSSFLLILKQPDLGTAVSILLSCGIVLLCAGLKTRHLILLGSTAAAGITFCCDRSLSFETDHFFS